MANRTGKVTSSRLNLRRDPSMDHPAIVALPRGTEVEVLGQEGAWYRVRVAGQEGYVSTAYLEVREAPPPPKRTGRVTASSLHVRAGASTTHPVVGRLAHGASVEILDRLGGWLRVRSGAVEGFVSGQYVDTGAAAATPGAPAPAGPAPVAAGADFLFARPELQSVPLPPERPLTLAADLPSTARAAGRTWNSFGGLLGKTSEALGLPAPAAVSVLCVESGGAGFKDGRMIIRFENHVFFNYWGKKNPERFAEHFAFDSAQKWKGHRFRAGAAEPWSDFHGSQDREWRVFEFARALDEAAAMYSISMGAPQIMGFNHQRIGYRSVQDMFAAFSRDVRYHILGMFDFIRGDRTMVDALRTSDFEKFAGRYNGSGQAARYGALIRQHSDACSRLLAAASPRIG